MAASPARGCRVDHSIAAYLAFAQDLIPNIIGEHTRWGLTARPIAPPPFELIADEVAQLYKQCTNTARRARRRDAQRNVPHPGSLRAGGNGEFDPPSPFEVELLLGALASESRHRWCVDEDDEENDE
jgi:hypothetical protein